MDEHMDEGNHPDQLSPVAMPYHNRVMKGPPGTDIRDVSTYVGPDADGRHAMTSLAYVLDDRQREMVANGAHVALQLWQVPMPPVAVLVEGPFCDMHRCEKVWTGKPPAGEGFVCLQCVDASSSEDPGTQ